LVLPQELSTFRYFIDQDEAAGMLCGCSNVRDVNYGFRRDLTLHANAYLRGVRQPQVQGQGMADVEWAVKVASVQVIVRGSRVDAGVVPRGLLVVGALFVRSPSCPEPERAL
jgi:hypothetical protein